LLIVFYGNGYTMNGTSYDDLAAGGWNSIKTTMYAADNLYIGSAEGVHHSRAIYPYIRVIRDREM